MADDEQQQPVEHYCEACLTVLMASADVRDGFVHCTDCLDAFEEADRRA